MYRPLAAAAALVLSLTPLHAQTTSDTGYHVLKRVTLGGEGGWDYLTTDPVGRRLYISRSTHVMVVDLDQLTVVGDIPNTNGVHGIALAPGLNRGFTSNGRDTSVTIFDLKTLAILGTVKVTGANPDAIAFDSVSGRVFTFNGRGGNTTAIDAATGQVAGTIDLGGKPEFAVSDGKGRIYVNIEDKSELVAIDTKKLTVLATWSIAPGESPSGLAMDRAHQRLFSGCDNKTMTVVDPASGKVVATIPIGEGVDAAAWDAEHGLAFSSNGEGTMTIAHEDSPNAYHVVATVPTQRGARTMTLDPKTGRAFTVTAEFGTAPAATADNPRPRPPMVPGNFTLIVVGK